DWRWDELNHLKNILSYSNDERKTEQLRKSLVVVLYAHFEGFCVFALQHYQQALNTARLTCVEVVPAIVAGSWEHLFRAMETGDEKCDIFSRKLPNDPYLHRHWRRRHFV